MRCRWFYHWCTSVLEQQVIARWEVQLQRLVARLRRSRRFLLTSRPAASYQHHAHYGQRHIFEALGSHVNVMELVSTNFLFDEVMVVVGVVLVVSPFGSSFCG